MKSLQYVFLLSCSIVKKICLVEVCLACIYLNCSWTKLYGLLEESVRVMVLLNFQNDIISSRIQTYVFNEETDLNSNVSSFKLKDKNMADKSKAVLLKEHFTTHNQGRLSMLANPTQIEKNGELLFSDSLFTSVISH
jgi:hypothetical protein